MKSATRSLLRVVVIAVAGTMAALAGGCAGAGGRGGSAHRIAPAAIDLQRVSGPEVMGIAREPGARAVLVNVWATWCQPCREEFPDLLRVAAENRDEGLRVILVSGDFPDQETRVREFLAGHGVEFRTYLKTGKDMEFVEALDPSWSGTLPATWVYDGAGARRAFWGGKTTYDSLHTKIRDVLASSREGEPR